MDATKFVFFILMSIFIILLLNIPEEKKDNKIVYTINESAEKEPFTIAKAGEWIFPTNPFLGWIIFIIIITFIYQGIRKTFFEKRK